MMNFDLYPLVNPDSSGWFCIRSLPESETLLLFSGKRLSTSSSIHKVKQLYSEQTHPESKGNGKTLLLRVQTVLLGHTTEVYI